MNTWINIYKLFKIFNPRRKLQLFFVFITSIISGFLEAFSIASFLPFLGAITNSDDKGGVIFRKIFDYFLRNSESTNYVVPASLLFIFLTILTVSIRIINLWFAARISFLVGSDIGTKLYQQKLQQPYGEFITTNSSSILNALTYQSPNIFSILLSTIIIITAAFISLCTITGLILIDIQIALTLFITVATIYFIVSFQTRKFLRKNSKIINKYGKKQIQSLQEGIGLIRDIILEDSHQIFFKNFKFYDRELNLRRSLNKFLSAFPRLLIEGIILILMTLIAITVYSNNGSSTNLIAIFGTYALAAQRLISYSQQIYSGWSNIESKSKDLSSILSALKNNYPSRKFENSKIEPLNLKKEIVLSDITFRYSPENQYTIRNLNLSIKGTKNSSNRNYRFW